MLGDAFLHQLPHAFGTVISFVPLIVVVQLTISFPCQEISFDV